VNLLFTDVQIDAGMNFAVTVNGEAYVEECNDTNNESEAGPVRCVSVE